MKDIEKYKLLFHQNKMFSKWAFCTIMLFYVLIFTSVSCDKTIHQNFQDGDFNTISKYIESNPGKYSRFWRLMVVSNLDITLSAYNPYGEGYTLFLPTDEAFDLFILESKEYDKFDDLLKDTDFVNQLARYHLVNSSIESNNFSFGDLPDTTATGDLLTVGFEETEDSTTYMINNTAPVINANINLINGYIHVIGKVIIPVTFSSYDWISVNKDFSIFAEALNITGLCDTLGIYRRTSAGNVIRNQYTLLAEPDSVFAKQQIFNIEDLKNKFPSTNHEIADTESELYQYVAYHIIEGNYFLDDFDGDENFNTYANYPLQVSAGLEIKLNPGKDTLEIMISGQDTTIIDYVRISMDKSNILTKNGAIHILQDHLKVRTPAPTSKTFQFLEENIISNYSKTPGEYYLEMKDTELLSWEGPDNLKYIKSANTIPANNNDYIMISGNFVIRYIIPKLLPGKYEVRIKAESNNTENATIQVYIDGKRMGSSFDLTSGGNPFNSFRIGTVDLLLYDSHTIEINTLLPGRFIWDFVQFNPI